MSKQELLHFKYFQLNQVGILADLKTPDVPELQTYEDLYAFTWINHSFNVNHSL